MGSELWVSGKMGSMRRTCILIPNVPKPSTPKPLNPKPLNPKPCPFPCDGCCVSCHTSQILRPGFSPASLHKGAEDQLHGLFNRFPGHQSLGLSIWDKSYCFRIPLLLNIRQSPWECFCIFVHIRPKRVLY